MYLKMISILSISMILLSSCDKGNIESKTSPQTKKIVVRNIDTIKYSYGQKLFLKNCASCHGNKAEGTEHWRKTNKDGKYPPPPLNGTAHAWHHSLKVLSDIIKDGTADIGGDMPAWKDKLSDKEIESILVFIQAQWPDEIYAIWYENYYGSK